MLRVKNGCAFVTNYRLPLLTGCYDMLCATATRAAQKLVPLFGSHAREIRGATMKVEVLYVAHCPTHPAAVAIVRDVIASQNVSAEVLEILVPNEAMANELHFRGSPTVRVNGRDVVEEPEGTAALCCRVYSYSSQIGLPPVDAIRRAIIEATQGLP